MTDWSELKRLAEAQPSKEWSHYDAGMSMYAKQRMWSLNGPECVSDHENWGFTRRAASFIAAANPAVVLALIAEVERLQRAEKNDLIAYKAAIQRQDELRKERDQLKAEAEALRDSPISAARSSYKEIELAARSIYESWADRPEYVPWVDGGNSLKQCEARRLAMSKENGDD